MKRIACFCIPAHGHTNPMLPVAAELVKRGNGVRFYSFLAFKAKIEATGAEFVACDRFLSELTAQEAAGLKQVSTTEMTIQDIRITLSMDEFLGEEFQSFRPDVVYTDSVCFWGKLNAWKHKVPMVVSTSTFAFNQLSSEYMKNSPRELADMILGLPRVSAELKKLEPYGYHVKGALSLIQSDNDTDSVVYTSRRFQPYAESFSDHYMFVGPSVFSEAVPEKAKERPLIYISMGTVINDRPDFYSKCAEALGDLEADVIISCGNAIDREVLGELPGNVQVYPYVNQLEVLSKADVFLTHCGMNSVSESLYMATPMVLYPQTGEQKAVARRAAEIGAGTELRDDSAAGIRAAVLEILNHEAYAKAALECSEDFRACAGPAGAAEFIENAPHASNGADPVKEFNLANAKFRGVYWAVVTALILLVGFLAGWKYVWMIGVAAGMLSHPIGQIAQKKNYRAIVRRVREEGRDAGE
ncbi:MAG: glycosyl transferase [Lachnospiraceae bacterium]|nr:glycosyl transferase [Lachnospiraceae bacterium]